MDAGNSVSRQAEKDYYSRRWSEHAVANLVELARAAKIIGSLCELQVAEPKICDLGCGSGWLTSILACFGATLGVDLADVSPARERYPRCEFLSTDILGWDSPEGQYDVVVSQEVIEHIPYTLQNTYLAKAARLLRVGGYLILTTPNARTLEAVPGGGREWSDQPLEEVLSKGELTRLISEQFEVISVRSFIFGIGRRGSYRFANSDKVRRLMASVGLRSMWDSLLGRCNYGLHFIAIARKR